MGMQTAYLNQPYAATTVNQPMGGIPGANANTLASYVIPLSAPPATAARPSMTQLPYVPPPPFLNSANTAASALTTPTPYSTAQSVPFSPATPTTPSGGGLGALPDIPTPAQLLGGASASGSVLSSQPSTSNATGSNPAWVGPYAEIPPLPEIPPPHIAAPWVYLQRGNNPPQLPQTPYGQGYPAASSQSQAQGKFPQSSNQGQQPPPMQQQPPQPPVPPPQPQQQQQPPQPPQQKKPSVDLDEGVLSDEIIKKLNKRLEDPEEEVRADATIDLFKILEKHPQLADDPNYKPYIDAFAEKIMQDPSPVVRAGGELILKMGEIPNPSPLVQTRLKELSTKDDLTSEGGIASDILSDYETGTIKKKKAPAPPAEANNPNQAANPDNTALSNHKNIGAMPGGFPGSSGYTPAGYTGWPGGTIPTGSAAAGWPPPVLPPGSSGNIPPPQPPDPQATNGTSPPQFGGAGGRLNMMSPQQATPAGFAYSQAGQRLNIQGV